MHYLKSTLACKRLGSNSKYSARLNREGMFSMIRKMSEKRAGKVIKGNPGADIIGT